MERLIVGKMRAAAGEATELLRALANSDRLLLLCRLSQGECCVGDLEEELGIAQPTLSQQLAVLRNQELVDARRDGKRIYYSVRDPQALALLEALYRLYCAPRRRLAGIRRTRLAGARAVRRRLIRARRLRAS